MSIKKKCVASYSGGKDSALALYRAIKNEYEVISLLTTYDEDKGHSWFHNIPEEVLHAVSESLAIPIYILGTNADHYNEQFENALLELKNQGAEACVFGDIDIEEHRGWCSERCINVGIESYFPLWQEDRKNLVYECIDLGFKADITVVDTSRMSEAFLGCQLTRDIVDGIAQSGADICGENGEYHTFVSDGPIFKRKVDVLLGETTKSNKHARKPILGLRREVQE